MNVEQVATLSSGDASRFRDWFLAEISQRYPLSSQLTADWLLELGAATDDPNGYFTIRKSIWKITSPANETIGFTIATEKRGGSVKFGPTLVELNSRGKGVGRYLRLRVEEHFRACGYRKAYSTTNLKNLAGVFYLTAIGYRIEAHLRAHYSPSSDEVVLGKFLSHNVMPASRIDENVSSALLRRLAPNYDGLDEKFETNLFRCATNEVLFGDESAYTRKEKILFGDPSENFCVTTPKRRGVVKIGPLLVVDPDGLRSLLGEVERYYRQREIRKLYCLVPVDDAWQLREIRLLGWELEGTLREPYRRLSDIAVLSRFFETGQTS